MLPDGYSWRPYLDGSALYLGLTVVAMVSPIASGVRVAINVGTNHLRFVFLPSAGQGTTYIEAWVRKWDSEIRAERAATLPAPRPATGRSLSNSILEQKAVT